MDLYDLARYYNLIGQTVVITGGTGTLGGEIACALVGCGANVAILDRNMDPAERILNLMEPRANHAVAVRADVLDIESLREAAKVVLEKFGTIHALVNAAGGNNPKATTNPDLSFFDLPPEALRWVFDLNILGTMLPSQVFGKIMADKGEGVVLNISSMNAFRPLTRIPAYSAAKAGVATLPNGSPCIWLRFIRREFASTPSRQASSRHNKISSC